MDLDDRTKYLKVLRTLLDMLKDRGYHIPPSEYEKLDSSISEEFSERIKSYSKEGNSNEKIIVFFEDKEKITSDDITDRQKFMNEKYYQNAIIITKQGAIQTSLKQSLIDKALQSELKMEHFEENELLVNITRHELVPKHVLITDAEKEALLKRYKLKESQLPKILATDPVARYYGLKRRQVVKIIRTSETAGQYVTYRIVV